eukprot:gene5555-19005_t
MLLCAILNLLALVITVAVLRGETEADGGVLRSKSTCEELGYDEGVAACSNAGGRLCTLAETFNDVVQGTGCNLDLQSIWTSNECDNGHLIAPSRESQMSTKKITCTADNAAVASI